MLRIAAPLSDGAEPGGAQIRAVVELEGPR